MDTRCLTVDIGTTWAKLAVYDVSDPLSPRPLESRRLPSGAGAYDGFGASVAVFRSFCHELEALIGDCLTAHQIDRVGLTGIREGLVLLDEAGEVLWVSGNALLDNELMLDRPIGGIDIGGFIPGILSRNASAHALLSLQGYLAYRLTGCRAITGSEMEALGLLRRENAYSEALRGLLQSVDLVPVGVAVDSLANCPQTRLYLAGTDEQASHHGAGLGTTADLGLATATFWSLTAAAAAPPQAPEVRYIPAQVPYCASASVIGYRFGPCLQEALGGTVPAFPDRLPRWAVGTLLDYLRTTSAVTRERLVDCVVADFRSAHKLLAPLGDLPAEPVIAVHGGGLTGLRDFTVEVMERLGHRWVALEGDATQIGCCLAAQ